MRHSAWPFTGSSPRVRGTHLHCGGGGRRNRFIPACAGNTLRFQAAKSGIGGSSPRVRGTQGRNKLQAGPFRFIPACAGNTSTRTATRGAMPVHPRVCGEHLDTRSISPVTLGSSPRVRGTLRRDRYQLLRRRFIPACAGNTRLMTDAKNESAVHPRVCGEHPYTAPKDRGFCGSSPRVRGTPMPGTMMSAASRFIPACAGNTARWVSRPTGPAVHPRVCGEHWSVAGRCCCRCGSSPRVRGTRGCSNLGVGLHRFIPACAGNTPTPRRSTRASPVHPRVCGEHLMISRAVIRRSGSSPRVRGTRGRRAEAEAGRRFIPACAGNTRWPAHRAAAPAVHPRVCGEHGPAW